MTDPRPAPAAGAPAPTPGEFSYEISVRYGDTDQMGVAYYANYLYWFEIARTEWLRAHGTTYREIEAAGIVLPVTEAHCRYHASAHYDDRLRLVAWVADLGRATLQFDYRVERVGDDRLLATGSTRHCFLDRAGRPVRIAGGLRDMLGGGLPNATRPAG
jgi:acyl-CoA thioester hydrolase